MRATFPLRTLRLCVSTQAARGVNRLRAEVKRFGIIFPDAGKKQGNGKTMGTNSVQVTGVTIIMLYLK
jgi:hypothetical protein